MMISRLLATAAVWLISLAAQAGEIGPTDPLPMPEGPVPFAGKPEGNNATRIHKPPGDGPFPAVVIMPTCGGVRSETFDWAKRGLDAGFAVMVVDTLGPRGVRINCFPPLPVMPTRLAKDAFQALAHLRSFPFIDPDRISVMGMSQGGGVAVMLSGAGAGIAGKPFVEDFPAKGFASAVAFYPVCSWPERNIRYVPSRIDTPLLVLMGGRDNETPPENCLSLLEEQKAAGAPVEWELYSGATHCWDCSSLHNRSKRDWRGDTIEYRHDSALTETTAKRAFEFMAGAQRR